MTRRIKKPFGKIFSHDFVRVHQKVVETAQKVAGCAKLPNLPPFAIQGVQAVLVQARRRPKLIVFLSQLGILAAGKHQLLA